MAVVTLVPQSGLGTQIIEDPSEPQPLQHYATLVAARRCKMTLYESKVSRRASLAIVPLTVLLLSNVGHANPPTAITTCGFEIRTPGHYYLATDLTCPDWGITIRTNDVSLRLDGHTLQGSSGGNGITVAAATNIVISGPGTVTGFGQGVALVFTQFATVIGVTATGNSFHGFVGSFASNNVLRVNEATLNGNGISLAFGTENMIVANRLINNGGGIDLSFSDSNKIYANTANSNGRGITLLTSTKNEILGNTAVDNTISDMFDLASDCDDNLWRGNRFNTANQPCIQ
jgi:parallel beta-helix repeat protein